MTFKTELVSAEIYNEALLRRSEAKHTPAIVSKTEQRHRLIDKKLSVWRKDILKEDESSTSGKAKGGKAKKSGKADDQQLVGTVVTDIENNENGTLRRSQRKRAIPK